MAVLIVEGRKACTKCGITKPLSDFSPRLDRPIGHNSRCKKCRADTAKERWHDSLEENRARQSARQRKNRDKMNASRLKWEQKNPEKKRLYVAAWEARNKDNRRVWRQVWRAENPDKVREFGRKHGRRREARKRAAGEITSHHAEAEWQDLLQRSGGRCADCKRKTKLTRDHIIPLSKGGGDEITNIQPLCKSCNSRKKDKRIHLI